jgi:predicted ATPase/class 3 adenylate cyclase
VDTSDWLRGLGLERYEQAFLDKDVDMMLLPDLAEVDLEKLGVASLGHRKRLLRAIEALRSPGAGLATGAAAVADDPWLARPPPASRPEAGRRQLTVMFVDLVGSTALSTRLDPEDLREVIGAYQDAVTREVTRFDGHVAKFMGDGVLAYFGFPRSHEDDAERAVRTGLEIIGAIGRLRSPDGVPLAARIGIATGLVVVGEMVGSGASEEQAVVGETPNLAARLQSLAEPGSVVIAEGTHRLIGSLFEQVDLGAVEAKGFATPVRAYRVVGIGTAASRFEAFHAAALAPLVAREEEMDLLMRRWHHAAGGEGRVVLLSGEPGVGKSRLLAALPERLGDEPHRRLHYFCAAHRQDSPLHPFSAQLERAAGFARGDPPETRLEKLVALLASAALPAEDVAPLAELLSLPTRDGHGRPPLAPRRQRERTFEALLRPVERWSRHGPVLMVVEDVHWIDPSSRELLDLAIERAARLPVLLVVTCRPEFQPPWIGQHHVTSLVLSRLGQKEGTALVQRVAVGAALSDDLVATIVARADGVPLFLEELTKEVIEAGAGHGLAASPSTGQAVPATLHAALMARLDRLDPTARDVAQIGATIGRDFFSHELLAAVFDADPVGLAAALDQLTAAGLVFRRGEGMEAGYLFKHALVRDSAYGTLLRDRRRGLHAGIARVVAARWTAGAADGPETVAHHFTEAELPEPATAWWFKAGQLAAARSAYVEAVHHLRRGLDANALLPATRERSEHELRLWRALGAALAVIRGYAGPEVGEAFARALTLCRELGNDDEIFPVLYALWVHRLNRAEYLAAGETAREFMERADQGSDEGVILTGHTLVGSVWLMQGQFAAARQAYERTIALYRPERHRALVAEYVTDRRVVAKQLLAETLGALGYWDLARRHAMEAAAEAREFCHPATEAYALWLSMMLWQVMGEVDEVEAHAERLTSLALELGADFWLGIAGTCRGWAKAVRGDVTTAVPLIQDGIARFRASGGASSLTNYLTLLAAAHRIAGEDAEALARIGDAEAEARRTGEERSLAEINRIRGEILVSMPLPDLEAGEASLRDAVALARAQDAKGWELRAATSLARLLLRQGKRQEARDLLAPVYGWFTEGFDTTDLRDAKALLDELG